MYLAQIIQSLFTLVRPPTARSTSIQSLDTQPSSIGLLPVELLLAVFELLERNRLAICMRVCKRWYDIASPYFFATLPVRPYFRRQHFPRYFRQHPELAEYVNDIYFFAPWWECNPKTDSCPFDIQLLAPTLPALKNLRRLFVVDYDDKIDRPLPLRRSAPVALQQLTFESCKNVAFILHGLLPLFSIDTLIMGASSYWTFGSGPPADVNVLFPPASVTIRNIVFSRTEQRLYEAFARALAPGVLRALSTGCWWRGDLPILDRFLRSSAAENLLSISVGGLEPLYDPPRQDTRRDSEIPAKRPLSICDILRPVLARCTCLQFVRIGLIHREHTDVDPFLPCHALGPLLAGLPESLRAFALHIWIQDFPPQPCHWSAATTRHLDDVDRLLDPAGEERRFPDLQRVEFHVHYWYRRRALGVRPTMGERPRCEEGVTLLPRIQAAGLLQQVQVYETERGPDHSADIYWPLAADTM